MIINTYLPTSRFLKVVHNLFWAARGHERDGAVHVRDHYPAFLPNRCCKPYRQLAFLTLTIIECNVTLKAPYGELSLELHCIVKYSQSESTIAVVYILRYATGSFPSLLYSYAGSFWGLSKSAQKLFNSCECLRTVPITSVDFPMISEQFRRFSKIFKNFKNLITPEKQFWTVCKDFPKNMKKINRKGSCVYGKDKWRMAYSMVSHSKALHN